jgi:hypothetical protein
VAQPQPILEEETSQNETTSNKRRRRKPGELGLLQKLGEAEVGKPYIQDDPTKYLEG